MARNAILRHAVRVGDDRSLEEISSALVAEHFGGSNESAALAVREAISSDSLDDLSTSKVERVAQLSELIAKRQAPHLVIEVHRAVIRVVTDRHNETSQRLRAVHARSARNYVSEQDEDYIDLLLTEAHAWSRLAEMGVESILSSESAVTLFAAASVRFDMANPETQVRWEEAHIDAKVNEAVSRFRLAELEVDALSNLEAAASRFEESRELLAGRLPMYLYWLSVNLIFLCASFGEKQFLI